MPKYDLAVAYRIYPGLSNSGKDFFKNKFEMSDICLKSFKNSLGSLNVKIWAIMDNCPKEYEDLFLKYFMKNDIEFILLGGSGNAESFSKQMEILMSQDLSDFVYFAEDDYLYLPGSLEMSLRFMKTKNDADFISLYDHPDYYHYDLSLVRSMVLFMGDRHWRDVGSTCLTFMTRKQTLIRTAKIFFTYKKNNYDVSIWLILTKHKVFNLGSLIRCLATDSLSFKIIAKSWLYGWHQILFGKKRILWVPVPGLATHISSNLFAPGIDWNKYLEEMKACINEEK